MKNYFAIFRKQERPTRFLIGRILVATGICRLFTIYQTGYQLHFHPANLSCQLWINPLQREDALVFFRDYLKLGDRVIDVGANIGDTVLTASTLVGKTGLVIGLEPHPRTFLFLEENIQLNRVQNVQVINSAVGNMVGEVAFSDDRRDDMNRVAPGSLKVSIKPLDDLISLDHPIALLKVDVEGYEKFVLMGATKALKMTKCLYFEIGFDHFEKYGYTILDLLSLVERKGFQIFRIIENGLIQRIRADYITNHVENLIGVRDQEDFIKRTGWQLVT